MYQLIDNNFMQMNTSNDIEDTAWHLKLENENKHVSWRPYVSK